MKYLVLIMFLQLGVYTSQAQNYGYLGRKNFIDIKAIGNVPVVVYLIENGFWPSSFFENWRFGALNGGFSCNVGRTINSHSAFSIEVSAYYAPYSFVQMTAFQNTNINRSISFMPIVEFTKPGATLPLGYSNKIGIGMFQLVDYYTPEYTTSSKIDEYTGVSFLYEFGIRTTITDFLFMNYGVRYTLNYVPGEDQFNSPLIQKTANFISLDLGLSIVF